MRRSAEIWMKKVLILRCCGGAKRGLLGAPKMDFIRLRNESTLTMILVEISTEITYRSEYLCRSGSDGVSKYQAAT
jgi:hypothetical protein